MKAAIYSRKSKFKEEGESIKNQIEMCIKYADVNLGITEYEIYQDEGFSGGNTNRPQFQKMLLDLKKKKFTHLICYRLDRISRNVADFSTTLESLNKLNIGFISIKEQFDTTTAMGRAMMNISATFAQLERETIAERIKDNLRELAKTGRWLGGPAPLGYNSIEVVNNDGAGKSRKKHILEINNDEIEIVKLVYDLFIEHKSFQKISRILESKHIYSRSGTVFSRQLVKQTLLNPTYVIADDKIINYFKDNNSEVYIPIEANNKRGISAYNRRKENGALADKEDWIISIGEHEGVIDSDKYIYCQQIMDKIKKDTSSNRKGTSQEALLSGLVVCAKCGSGMAPAQNKSGKYHYRYYTCNLKNKSSKRCSNNSLNAYDAEDRVIDTLLNLDENEIIENYEKFKKKSLKKKSNIEQIKMFKDEIKTNTTTINNLVLKLAYLDNDKDLMQPFLDNIKSLKETNIDLENKIIELENENENIEDLRDNLNDILDLFRNFKKFYKFTDNFEDKKALINTVVKFVTWDYDKNKLKIILKYSDIERTDILNSTSHLGNCSRSNNSLNVKILELNIPKRRKRLTR